MKEHREPTGGLRTQLRDLAERGSFDGHWLTARPQRVLVSREATIPTEEAATLQVAFKAERFKVNAQLLTRYAVSATLLYESLPVELVPGQVRLALQARRLHEWHQAQVNGTALLLSTSAEDETDSEVLQALMYQDVIATDDVEFRFERSVSYAVDGRGQLLSEQRTERFYDEDANVVTEAVGGVDLTAHSTPLEHLAAPATEHFMNSAELLVHPDLRKLEYKLHKDEVKTFLTFAEVISRVEQDRELAKVSQRARQQEALSLLAFLRYERSAAAIIDTLR